MRGETKRIFVPFTVTRPVIRGVLYWSAPLSGAAAPLCLKGCSTRTAAVQELTRSLCERVGACAHSRGADSEAQLLVLALELVVHARLREHLAALGDREQWEAGGLEGRVLAWLGLG